MLKPGDNKKKYWLISVFLFVLFSISGIGFVCLQSEPGNDDIDIETTSPTLPTEKLFVEQKIAVVAPRIVFRLNNSTNTAYLSVSAVTRKEVLHHIASEMKFEIITNENGEQFLQEVVSFEIEGHLDLVIRKLLGNGIYSIFSVQSENKENSESVFYCIGENACPDHQTLIGRSTTDDENVEEPIVPSQQFREMIAEPVTPGTKVNIAERASVLRDEFYYASTDTKIQILHSLSVSTDLDFIINALRYEEKTPVREAAVEKLFFSNEQRATLAMLETLNDSDEKLVITVLNVLSRSEDEDLMREASGILANHPGKAIKITLKNLGYPQF